MIDVLTDEQVKELVKQYRSYMLLSKSRETSIGAVKFYSNQWYKVPLTTDEVKAILNKGSGYVPSSSEV